MTELVKALKPVFTEIGAGLARRAAFFAVIFLLIATATGFAVAAGWSLMAELHGGAAASIVTAGSLLIVALIALGVDTVVRRRHMRKLMKLDATRHPPALAPLLIQTFIASMHAGQSLRARR